MTQRQSHRLGLWEALGRAFANAAAMFYPEQLGSAWLPGLTGDSPISDQTPSEDPEWKVRSRCIGVNWVGAS